MQMPQKPVVALASALVALTIQSAAQAQIEYEPWDEFVPLVEINASDGDVGFHVLIDGGPWEVVQLMSPRGRQLFRGMDWRGLREQGLTELFMESAEPPCWFDAEDEEADPEEIFTVDDFVERFPAGVYRARGRTVEGEFLRSFARLTHNLPAAPLIEADLIDDTMTIYYARGTDLGECEYSDSIPDPAGVDVVRWELVVEVDEEELPEDFPATTFNMQVPANDDCGSGEGDYCSLVVPSEFLQPYLDAEVSVFKIEVGAMEASHNATFTEIELELDD